VQHSGQDPLKSYHGDVISQLSLQCMHDDFAARCSAAQHARSMHAKRKVVSSTSGTAALYIMLHVVPLLLSNATVPTSQLKAAVTHVEMKPIAADTTANTVI
jgi:hypothetical protein